MTQVLFIQGAGADTYEQWDVRLVSGLRMHLGPGFEVLYPPMPDADDPRAASWIAAIQRAFGSLEDGDVLVGHSFGGTMLLHALVTQPPMFEPAALVLLATPFYGPGGWQGKGMLFPADLAQRLPGAMPVHAYHGTRDDTVPFAHLALFADALPAAVITAVPDADHQFNDDLASVAHDIAGAISHRT